MTDANSAKKIETSKTRVACDGGGGALGHPKVFFEFKQGERRLLCTYCGQEFRKID